MLEIICVLCAIINIKTCSVIDVLQRFVLENMRIFLGETGADILVTEYQRAPTAQAKGRHGICAVGGVQFWRGTTA